jgi:uncharacterized protein
MRTIPIRLRPGQDLKQELIALNQREQIQAGWVLTCVGSLSRLSLRLAGASSHLRREAPFEIVSLVGTFSPDGVHLHLAVADEQGAMVGGHLADGCVVRTTAEIVVGADDAHRFSRHPDPTTGYDELAID